MAVAPRHLRCLFSQAARLSVAPTGSSTAFGSPTTTTPNLPQSRSIHSSPLTAYPRIKKGVPKDLSSLQEPETKPYTAEQVDDLKKLYAPDQLEAILAGEHAIDRKDFLLRRRRHGGDPYAIKYVADFAKYDPLLDFPQQDYIPETGHPMQPLPVIEDPKLSWPKDDDEAGSIYRGDNLSRLTGFSIEQLKRFTVRSMVFHRVVNQTRMGKIQRFYALNIAGNGNGLIGIGEGKSAEPGDAGQIATYMALRNLEPIPRYEGRTIYGKVQVKIGAVELELRTAPPGYGVRASEPIFEICRCLGIQDLSAKITRSRNRMNVVKAVMHGLRNQKLPDTLARGRGLKLVDVRKTYYNGSNLGSSQFMGN